MTDEVGAMRILVLAGGLGTRLRAVVSDRPKLLAPVAGRTFIDVLVERLHARGIRRIGLLLGHLHEQVEQHVAERLAPAYPDVDFAVSVEKTPLGTGGALRNAAALVDGTTLVMNGDTYFDFNPAALLDAHRAASAPVTVLARRVADSGRYGALDVAVDGGVRAFREKDPSAGAGLVNAGVYAIAPRLLDWIPEGRAVSLERETFPALIAAGERIQAATQDGPFIDIGTPESHAELEAFLSRRSS